MQIPYSANICPYCRKRVKTSSLSILIAALFATIMFVFVFVFNSKDSPPNIPAVPSTTTNQTLSKPDDNGKSLKLISVNNDTIKIGDTHDSVVDRIPKIASVSQTEEKIGDYLVVKRKYKYGSKYFELTFSTVPPEHVYRVIDIIEYERP